MFSGLLQIAGSAPELVKPIYALMGCTKETLSDKIAMDFNALIQYIVQYSGSKFNPQDRHMLYLEAIEGVLWITRKDDITLDTAPFMSFYNLAFENMTTEIADISAVLHAFEALYPLKHKLDADDVSGIISVGSSGIRAIQGDVLMETMLRRQMLNCINRSPRFVDAIDTVRELANALLATDAHTLEQAIHLLMEMKL